MSKERSIPTESGFSEKQLDLAVDKPSINDRTKSSQVFGLQNKKKIKSRLRSLR